MKKPTVSIVLPTYNRSYLLKRAINSVLTQDYSDFELVIIDDGSTDNTYQIIEQFNDSRIIYIKLSHNQGVGHARHFGIKACRGDFIGFIDSDDMWLPGKLKYQMEAFEKLPQIDFLFGDYENINQNNNSVEMGFTQTLKGLKLLKTVEIEPGLMLIKDNLPQAMLSMNFFATPTVMFRLKVLEKIGNFRTDLEGGEDFEFWWRSAINEISFAYTQRSLIKRFKDNQSTTFGVITFIPRYLSALNYCEIVAKTNHRNDLIPLLRQNRHNAYRDLVRVHALEGNRYESYKAFKNALRYGFSTKLFVYFGGAFIGTRFIKLLKDVNNKSLKKLTIFSK